MKRCIIFCGCWLIVCFRGELSRATDAQALDWFRLSPPSVAPIEREGKGIHTNLRDLEDAFGLALLTGDETSASLIENLLRKWQQAYNPLTNSDPVLQKIDVQMSELFQRSLVDFSQPMEECQSLIASVPKEKIQSVLQKWIQNLLLSRGVSLAEDLKELSVSELQDICQQGRGMDSLKGLSSWQCRVVAWRYRDSEVKRLFADRDDRLTFLTPVHLEAAHLDPASFKAVHRYLAFLRNLKLRVLKDQELPYDRFRTLDGLVRGLRYMDTIREACEITGLDHHLMSRLFIQESEFIHQRVSSAGAFSLAQFLNIAIKDVWIFKNRIAGASILLKGINSAEELKAKVVADPRMAIKASCLYFRRIQDEIIQRMGNQEKRRSADWITLMTLEMYALHQSVIERSTLDSILELLRVWPVKEMMIFPVAPMAATVLPDSNQLLAGWVERVVRDLAFQQISEGVFEDRMARLYSALGLAAYNAGVGNLMKSAKIASPYDKLSFPLQLTETRNYVDDILDGVDILENVVQIASEVMQLDYEELIKLVEESCRLANRNLPKSKTVSTQVPDSRTQK